MIRLTVYIFEQWRIVSYPSCSYLNLLIISLLIYWSIWIIIPLLFCGIEKYKFIFDLIDLMSFLTSKFLGTKQSDVVVLALFKNNHSCKDYIDLKTATGKCLMWVCHWDESWKNFTPHHSSPSICTENKINIS